MRLLPLKLFTNDLLSNCAALGLVHAVRGFRWCVVLTMSTIINVQAADQKTENETAAIATELISHIHDRHDLFVSGENDTHTYRIPALIIAANGDLIAACDARRHKAKDLIHVRDIDIVLRRSSDNGKTWSPISIMCDYGDGRPASDPSFILDRTTGALFCFYNYMDQDNAAKEFRLYVQKSIDHGVTWEKGRDITDAITPPEWKKDFKFITSGRGLQTRAGALLHTLVNLKHGLHVYGSNDHGENWSLMSGPIKPADESKIMELADGSRLINARVNAKDHCRWVHTSNDAGKTWTSAPDRQLVEASCNASIVRYTTTADGGDKNRLLFCNANSAQGRKNLAMRVSYDEGATWQHAKVLDPGPSAYSSVTICADGSIGVLYEPGYGAVRFIRLTLAELTNGADRWMAPQP